MGTDSDSGIRNVVTVGEVTNKLFGSLLVWCRTKMFIIIFHLAIIDQYHRV